METPEFKLERVDKNDLFRRLGRVRISWSFFENPSLGCMKLLFGEFFPVEIINHLCSNDVEYLGMSTYFDIVPEGTIPPEYQFFFHRYSKEDGGEMVSLAEVKKIEQFERIGFPYEVIRNVDEKGKVTHAGSSQEEDSH